MPTYYSLERMLEFGWKPPEPNVERMDPPPYFWLGAEAERYA